MTGPTKHRKTQLVIIAEAALEKTLVREARERGALAWSVAEVHGGSLEGVREGQWEADRTVELKLICEPEVADAIAEQVLANYARHYAVSLHFSEVWVLRPERF
jgi:hypothetical protein